jgi:hypothetical protein
MPSVGFEPMIPVFEPAKTVHALGRAATVIGLYIITRDLKSFFYIIPMKIQALGVSCDGFLYTCIVEIYRQSTEQSLIVSFTSSSLRMREPPKNRLKCVNK